MSLLREPLEQMLRQCAETTRVPFGPGGPT